MDENAEIKAGNAVDEAPAMSPAVFASLMRLILSRDDAEKGHINMDKVMCDTLRRLGYGDGIDIFVRAPKWYA